MEIKEGKKLNANSNSIRGTTILAVRRNNETAIAADGQVTFGDIAIKSSAKKLHKFLDSKVIIGMAGAVSDCLFMLEKIESLLETYGNLPKAMIELAKSIRGANLHGQLLAVDSRHILILEGSGNVMQPEENVAAIGSGGMFAWSAAYALLKNTDLSAKDIVKNAMEIAAKLCIYTNNELSIEVLKEE